MKKKSVAVILILSIIFAAVFTAAACDPTNANRDLELSYDEESGYLTWSADWAITYTLKIYDITGGLMDSKSLTKETTQLLLDLQAGVYTVELTAHGTGEYKAVKKINVTIIGSQTDDDGKVDDTDVDLPTSAIDEPVKILNHTYYYLKSGAGDLSIGLVNTSGVKDVVAFGMINETVWEYSEKRNTLLLKPSYLHRFSSGAVLKVDVEYNDGETDTFDVQIVDVLPLQIIGGEDGLIEVNTTSTALNYKIYLGYKGVAIRESSYSIVKAVCIDGKKRASTDYLRSATQCSISLYYSSVLSSLKAGLHYLEIYTTYGKSEVWLNVINGKENIPCDVSVDFDSSYPEVFVTWDIFNAPDYFVVDIDGEEYSSVDYPQLFDGNSFNATGKIAVGNTATVKAVFDGVANYASSSKATLDVNIDSAFLSNYLSYDNGFEFLGTAYNYYINDFDEFFDLIYYSLLFYDELEASSVAGYEKRIVFYPNANAISNVNTSLKQVINTLNEAVKYSSSSRELLENSGVYELNLKVESSFVPNDTPDVSQMPIEQTKYQDTHYSATGRESNYEGFAVNSYAKEATVRLSEELYLAIERGVRPVPVEGSSADIIYKKVKSVLRQIIDDTMTDYQKVHAIYDWLGENVVYDWEINTKMGSIRPESPEYNKFYSYRQFYLEGVFIEGLAVCNGIAKAMSLMCGIEGIECYKIKGTSSGGAHAWNKVNVDGNWYVVDATWANRKYSLNSATEKETLAHYTVFMSEDTSGNFVGGAHYESFTGRYTNCYAGSDYNVFANTFFTYGSNIYDYVIDNAEELEILINYYTNKFKDSQIPTNHFYTIDVSCDLNTLAVYLTSIQVSGIKLYDYKGAASGVSTLIFAKE